MQVFGVMVVRNEADILRVNLAHHFALGIDRFLIADNGSSDGTKRLLEALGSDRRLLWTTADGPFRQSEITTALAREAFLRGADWVVPIDADEFWHAPAGDFRSVLERSSAGALEAEVVNFIQRREQVEARPEALLEMTRRTATPVGPIERIAELVEAREAAFVEILYPPKHVSRASLAIEIGQGNHSVAGVAGPTEKTASILCLHAPLRALSVLRAKVDSERPAEHLEHYLRFSWHVRRWRRLAERGTLEAEWRANSYAGEFLDVYGRPHPVVFDSRLRDVVAPWIDARMPKPPRLEGAEPPPRLFLFPHFGPARGERTGPILAQMRQVEGWLFEPEATVLMATVALALSGDEPHAIVEVGSYCGRSTVVLGGVVKALGADSRVYAIDPHEGEITTSDSQTRFEAPTLERFERNIARAGLEGIVQTIPKRSFEVEWAEPISLLFIDGLHDYGSVSRDFAHFERWVMPGGYVVFDDYDRTFPGVIAFVDEVLKSGEYRRVQTVGELVVTQKIERGPETGSLPAEAREAAVPADRGWLRERLARQERGIEFLRDILSEEIARRESIVAERDRMVADLQAELHAKVGECNRVIRDLQAELHAKVGECNRIIQDLQARLQGTGPAAAPGGSASAPEGGS
jgi:predicted O-methyltransferase YrrM